MTKNIFDQSQAQGDLSQLQGQSQAQGDQIETQGDLNAAQGAQSQSQGNQAETQGDQAQTQGDQTQGDLAQTQGDQSATQGDQSQTQGAQGQAQGDQSASQGDLAQTQGNQDETQGNLNASQGDLAQTQGDQDETQGNLNASQGDLAQTQGNLNSAQGDLSQTQGGETQGDQRQGDLSQTQGNQDQTLTGHGGQSVGDQTLASSPTISTPVNVSGVTVNVTVSCGDDCKKKKDRKDCDEQCREDITALLTLLKTFSNVVEEPEDSLVAVYATGLAAQGTIGNLGTVLPCTFTLLPETGSGITIVTDSFQALTVEETDITPNLFSLLLAYLESLPDTEVACPDECDKCKADYPDCCVKELEAQLRAFQIAGTQLTIFTESASFTGFIFKISAGIVYVVDDLTTPTAIDAIPLCKIQNYQPQ